MHSFLTRIGNNFLLKDGLALARGIYRVCEGCIEVSSFQDNPFARDMQKTKEHSPIEDIKIYYQQSKSYLSSSNTIRKEPEPIIEYSDPVSDQLNPSVESLGISVCKTKAAREASVNEADTMAKEVSHQNKVSQVNTLGEEQGMSYEQQNVALGLTKESSVPSSRLRRLFEFTKLGTSLLSFGMQAYVAKNVTDSPQQPIYEKAAQRITGEICRMRGAPLKLLQMLSIQEEELIPTPIRKAFETAREAAHVMPRSEVVAVLRQSLGDDWQTKFSKFQEAPFAAASIGQVHRAMNSAGELIAVKVQYPGVRRSITSDLANLKLLMKISRVFPKGIYVDRLLKKTEEELNQECDYLREARLQELYRRCLQISLGEQARLYNIPRVFPALTRESVLSSEFLSGVSLGEIETDKQHHFCERETKDEIGRRLMQLTFHELFQMGMMQSDPNPANYSYSLDQDRLNLFDFGATHRYNPKFLRNYYNIILASIAQDRGQIIQSSIDTGFLTGEENKTMLDSHVHAILQLGAPLRCAGHYDFGSQQITQQIYQAIPLMLKNRLKPPPDEVYSLHRKLSGSYLQCIRLGSRVNCKRIIDSIRFRNIVHDIAQDIPQDLTQNIPENIDSAL